MGGKTQQANKFTKPPFETAKSITIEKEREVAAIDATEENEKKSLLQRVNIFQGTKKTTEKMAEPKGLVTETLFTENIDDAEDRFTRLENAVQLLATKMQTMEPGLSKLVQIDQDLNNITKQLEILVSGHNAVQNQAPSYRDARLKTTSTPKTVMKSVVKPTIKPMSTPGSYVVTAESEDLEFQNIAMAAPQSLSNRIMNDIEKIRIADHPDKTRLVFEAAEKMDIAVAVEPNGRSLLISSKDGNTSINPSSFNGSSVLIKQAHVQDNSLLIKLSDPSDKIAQGYLPPTETNPNHRFYIDLKKMNSI